MLRPLADASGKVPDLRLSGHVSYATESSLEVFIRLSTIPPHGSTEEPSTILLGRFAMACRSSSGGKHKIAKLEVVGEEEEALWKMGKEMREGKVQRSHKSLEKTPPTEAESKLLHDLFVGRSAIFSEFRQRWGGRKQLIHAFSLTSSQCTNALGRRLDGEASRNDKYRKKDLSLRRRTPTSTALY